MINTKLNSCRNVRYIQDDAGKFMLKEADAGRKYDVVFMDPPRSGSDEAFLGAVARLKPERVVYISCNPETLARDVKFLDRKGYKMEKCVPVDMFPWCGHCESIALLKRSTI